MTKVQMQYEPFDDIIRRVADLRERVDDYRRRGRFILDLMDAGAWVGRGSDAFTDELLNQVLPSLDRLSAALEAITATLRAAMQQIQDAEQQGAALFKGGLATAAGVGALMGGLAAAINPYWVEPTDDGQLTGYKDAKILFINGIGTGPGDHLGGLRQISDMYGGRPVAGIYNKMSVGVPILGHLIDSFQTVGDWAESWSGHRVFDNPAVDATMEWIRNNPDGQLVAHSQGGAITSAALRNLEREGFDLTKLNVLTMGGAGPVFPDGPNYQSYETTIDPVPKLTRLINAPLRLLFPDKIHKTNVGFGFSFGDLIGHSADTYKNLIGDRDGGSGGSSGGW